MNISNFIENRNKTAKRMSQLDETEIVKSNNIRMIYSDESIQESYFNIFDQDIRTVSLFSLDKEKVIFEIINQTIDNDGNPEKVPYFIIQPVLVKNNPNRELHQYADRYVLDKDFYAINISVNAKPLYGKRFNVIVDISECTENDDFVIEYYDMLTGNDLTYDTYRPSPLSKNIKNFFYKHSTKCNIHIIDNKKNHRNFNVASMSRFFDSWINYSTYSSGDILGNTTGTLGNIDGSILGAIPSLSFYNCNINNMQMLSDISEPDSNFGEAPVIAGVSMGTYGQIFAKAIINPRGIAGNSFDSYYKIGEYQSLIASVRSVLFYGYNTPVYLNSNRKFSKIDKYMYGLTTSLDKRYYHYNNFVPDLLTLDVPYAGTNELETISRFPSDKIENAYENRPSINYYNCKIRQTPSIVWQVYNDNYGTFASYKYYSTNIGSSYFNCDVTIYPIDKFTYRDKETTYINSKTKSRIFAYPTNTNYYENCILHLSLEKQSDMVFNLENNIDDFELRNSVVNIENKGDYKYTVSSNSVLTGNDISGIINISRETDLFKVPFYKQIQNTISKNYLLFKNITKVNYDSDYFSTVNSMPSDRIFINQPLYYGYTNTKGIEIPHYNISSSTGPIYSETDANTYILGTKMKINNAPKYLEKIYSSGVNTLIVRIHPQFYSNQLIYCFNDSTKDMFLIKPKTQELIDIYNKMGYTRNAFYDSYVVYPQDIMDRYYILLLKDINNNYGSLIYDPVYGFVESSFTNKIDLSVVSETTDLVVKAGNLQTLRMNIGEMGSSESFERKDTFIFGVEVVGVFTVYQKIIADYEYQEKYNILMSELTTRQIELQDITKKFIIN